LPRFIANAEKRIFDELPVTAFNKEATGLMTALNPFIDRPEGMTITGNLMVNIGNSNFVPMIARTRTYIADFWPNQSSTRDGKPPRYFAPFSETQFIVAPTPGAYYGYKFWFQGDQTPLSASNSANVLTRQHYDLLLAACMVEAFRYSQEDNATEMMTRYEQQYKELREVARMNDLGITISDAQAATPRSVGA
jgi:uncharacterized membrane protein